MLAQPLVVAITKFGRNDDRSDVQPNDLFAFPVEYTLGRRIEFPDSALVIYDDDGVQGRMHDRPIPRFAHCGGGFILDRFGMH
jgi:hypothetical protein